MSPVPAFKTVVFIDDGKVSVFSQQKKAWKKADGEFSLDDLPSKDVKSFVTDGNVVAVVSDAYCGHLQVVVPNKKEEYTDERIGELLQAEHHIDLEAYEFASQRFPLGRESVQVSISGVEKEIYQKIEAWITALGAKKSWIMPFGWFVASLKSVEPALIAVILGEKRVLVSHHYLGVDDARAIELKQLKDYVGARQSERKETHLLYIQGDADLRREATTALGETVAVHPLLPEAKGDSLLAVVEAVMDKGADTLAELLHFVGEARFPKAEGKKADEAPLVEPVVPVTTPLETISAEEGISVASVDDLPKPTPPEESVMPETESVLETNEPSRSTGRTVVEVESESISESEAPSIKIGEEESVSTKVPEPILTIDASEAKEEPALVTQLQGQSSVKDNTDRYLEIPQKSRWKGPVLVFLAVAIITGIVGGAVMWSRQVWSPGPSLLPEATVATPTPLPTPEPTPEPEASPSATLTDEEKAETKVLVLNATGVAGLAGRVKTKLAQSGWTDVSTGNATGSYDGATFIYTTVESLIPVLSTDMGIELKSALQVQESGASNYDAVIILAEQISLE